MKNNLFLALFLVLLFSTMFWAVSVKPVVAVVIRVPEDVPTIQEAVDIAYDGDTIVVAAGTYYERINVTKSLILIGESNSNTIIDGSGIGYVLYITANDVQVSGFTIRNGDRGIYVKHSNGSIISGNRVFNNNYGIYLSIGSNNNNVSGNTVSFNIDYGIRVYSSSDNIISSNTVSNNPHGISLASYSSGNTVSNNIVSDNGDGIKLYNSTNNILSNNILSNNNQSIYISINSTGNVISGNTLQNNFFGIRLWYSGSNTLRSNTITGGTYNFWVYGDSLPDYIQDVDPSNLVDSKPIYYWVNQNSRQIPTDAGYVAAINSINITIRDLILSKNYHGVLLAYTKNSFIQNVEASSNAYGIKLFRSSGNTIIGNAFTLNNDFGVRLYSSNDTIINNNIVTSNNRYGIYLDLSINNILTNNNIAGNKFNFGVEGNSLLEYIQSIDYSNTVDGRPIYYWVNENSKQVPADAGYVAVINSTNVTVKDLTLTKNEHGVLLAYSNNTLAENITASNNHYGIYLALSSNNTLINNTMINNTYNFGVYGTSLQHFNHNANISNTVDGKPIYYWVNQHNQQIPLDAGYVAIINSSGITAKNLTLVNNYQGLLLAYTTGSLIQNVNASNNRFGLYLDYSSNNAINLNVVSGNHYRGIYLFKSNSNIIEENTISSNELGIRLHYSSDNTIYHNNFINNTVQAHQGLGSSNGWDKGYPIGGNYWSDYLGVDVNNGPNQDQPGSDGIGDVPYVINPSTQDRYPLYNMWASSYGKLGDLNLDGFVNYKDASIFRQAYIGEYNALADLNQDGVVNYKDASLFRNYYIAS